MKRCLIVGFGKVGSSLYLGLAATQTFDCVALDVHQSFQKAWAKFLPSHAFFNNWKDLQGQVFDLIAICTTDDQIPVVVQQLLRFDIQGKAVFHTSGSQAADVLSDLQKKGMLVGSLHPLQTFNRLFLAKTIWRTTVCTFQGEKELFALLQTVFQPLETKLVPIDAQQKRILHLAATIAANFQVALYSWADQLLQQAQLPEGALQNWLMPLIQQVSENLKHEPLPQILSGPLQRGDVNTITHHLQLLQTRQNPRDVELYRLLSLKLLENSQFNIAQREQLKKLLERDED